MIIEKEIILLYNCKKDNERKRVIYIYIELTKIL